MSVKQLTGKDISSMMDGTLVIFEEATLKITDGRKVVYRKGVPVGYADGPCSAEGTLKLDHENFLLVQEKAASAGSWKAIEPFDINFLAEVTAGQKNIDAHGCLIKPEDLLNAKAEGGESDFVTIKYEVTSKDFVHINGVPYLDPNEIAEL